MGLETAPLSPGHGEDEAGGVYTECGHFLSGALLAPAIPHSLGAHCAGNAHPQLSPSRAREDSKGLQEVKGCVHGHASRARGLGGTCGPGLGTLELQDLNPNSFQHSLSSTLGDKPHVRPGESGSGSLHNTLPEHHLRWGATGTQSLRHSRDDKAHAQQPPPWSDGASGEPREEVIPRRKGGISAP